ncbi:hypothetical protein AMAG_11867 [Allomyces macrogynus ATCC 38327]|uniref:C2H2-type domain-containing protein n=1 Tax=Allomyces macrogynus (strain ATCC 38327) TaxID=578462 RepID=A0A0L0SY23_ALLM3|nr:hypothetical protein AMAG_11867 [Allomyces macrogynus ATCC 38327]|eukprot:KNE67401.1 hypothetical protein AMAG_11867 [Allomyces macrogynus ATCC 38327]
MQANHPSIPTQPLQAPLVAPNPANDPQNAFTWPFPAPLSDADLAQLMSNPASLALPAAQNTLPLATLDDWMLLAAAAASAGDWSAQLPPLPPLPPPPTTPQAPLDAPLPPPTTVAAAAPPPADDPSTLHLRFFGHWPLPAIDPNHQHQVNLPGLNDLNFQWAALPFAPTPTAVDPTGFPAPYGLPALPPLVPPSDGSTLLGTAPGVAPVPWPTLAGSTAPFPLDLAIPAPPPPTAPSLPTLDVPAHPCAGHVTRTTTTVRTAAAGATTLTTTTTTTVTVHPGAEACPQVSTVGSITAAPTTGTSDPTSSTTSEPPRKRRRRNSTTGSAPPPSSRRPARNTRARSEEPAGGTTTANAADTTVPCLWFTCTARFHDPALLVPHLTTAHTLPNHNRANTCKWGGTQCPTTGTAPFASTDDLVRHVLEAHVQALFRAAAAGARARSAAQQTPAAAAANEDPAGTDDEDDDGNTSGAPSTSDAPIDLHVCQWAACAAQFPTFADLTIHVSDTHVGTNRTQYVCEWRSCTRNGRPFTQRQKCMRHLQTHTGHKPVQCTTCDKRFSEYGVLVGHMRTHTGEKPFTCDIDGCDKQFAMVGALTIHRRTHTGARPFACKFDGCAKRFAESSNLTKHFRTHTRERPFRCPECTQAFLRPDHLSRHLKVHGIKPGEGAAGASAVHQRRSSSAGSTSPRNGASADAAARATAPGAPSPFVASLPAHSHGSGTGRRAHTAPSAGPGADAAL